VRIWSDLIGEGGKNLDDYRCRSELIELSDLIGKGGENLGGHKCRSYQVD